MFRLLCPALLLFVSPVFSADTPQLSPDQKETFLLNAKIVSIKGVGVGVTDTRRATLNDGKMTHDAHVQCVDEAKTQFEGTQGTEMNFRDTWKYNVAAYRLGKILGIDDMIPVSVARKVEGTSCAVTWWVDDSMMETDRLKKKLNAPDPDSWNDEMHVVRVFDQLVYNTDRNTGNLLVDPAWRIWMIDHTRAFRLYYTLQDKKNLQRIDRKLLAKLRTLNVQDLNTIKPYLLDSEIKGVLRRRDVIVQFFDNEVKQKGEAAVLYDRPVR